MISVLFSFNGVQTTIYCSREEKIKDVCLKFVSKSDVNINNIFFIYGGKSLNPELTINDQVSLIDKNRNEMNILVCKEETIIINEEIKKPHDIICPECKDNCLINFNDYKIKLFECKNGHETNDILLNEYKNTQNINESNIICNNCNNISKNKSYNNQFYKCLTCKQNLCPLCKINHNNIHKIIDYDNIKYICENHSDFYISYCNDCKTNLCMSCELKHSSDHNIIYYKNIFPNEEKIKEEMNKFRTKIDILNNNIKEIVKILYNVSEYMEMYYKINYDIINNFNIQNKNYHVLQNLNSIINNIKKINIEEITDDNNIENKFKKLLNIYKNMTNKKFEYELINKESNKTIINNNIESENKKGIINSIIIEYEINNSNNKDNRIKLFDKKFIEKNKNNCKIIFENKAYEIMEYFDISHFNRNKDILEIKLNIINTITNISYIFNECKSLLSLPNISELYTDNIKDMSYMFSWCTSLKSLPDISKWNTSEVINMRYMFNCCFSLSSLPDISKWNTSKVTDMSGMFSVTTINSLPDISNWNTSNVTNMFQMFRYCSSLTSLPDISKWNTNKVTDIGYMFGDCSLLTSLPDISNWNTNNVVKMEYIFKNCSSLTTLPDISKWNIDKVSHRCKDNLNIPQKFNN